VKGPLDQFMNRVLDNAAEINGADKNEIGMVVHEYPGLDFPYKYLERGVLNVMS
jgi:small nuclear ribonucleoprotein (snRNP)-like protein